jgi:hypothetical protein
MYKWKNQKKKKKKSYHLVKEFSVTDPKGSLPLSQKPIIRPYLKSVQFIMLEVYFSKNRFNITLPSMLDPVKFSQFGNCYLQKSYLGILTRDKWGPGLSLHSISA